MSDPISLVAIRSARFPSAFLRMDGSNVTQFQNGGSGTVNCQYYEQGSLPTPSIGNDEVFELIPLNPEENGNGRFAIRSLSWGAFLRIDGSQVTQFQSGGSGTVNCQWYPGPEPFPTNVQQYEALEIIPLTTSSPVVTPLP